MKLSALVRLLLHCRTRRNQLNIRRTDGPIQGGHPTDDRRTGLTKNTVNFNLLALPVQKYKYGGVLKHKAWALGILTYADVC